MIPLSPVASYDDYKLLIRQPDRTIAVPSGGGAAVEQDAADPYAMVVYGGKATLYSPDGRALLLSDSAHPNDYAMPHSGDGRWLARSGDKLWACWMGNDKSLIGTPCWIAQVDLKGWKIESIQTLGYSNPKLTATGPGDNHATAQIIIGKSGLLYVVLGAHHGPILWLKSGKPKTILTETDNNAAFWPGKIVGPYPTYPHYGETYPALLIDPDDTIHVVSRSSAQNYRFQLVHWTISPKGETGPITVIDDAGDATYAVWYQHLSRVDNNISLTSQKFIQTKEQPTLTAADPAPVTRTSKDGGATWT